jgi:hypothetical protein
MSDELNITQNESQLRRGFGWKRIKNSHAATDAERREVKKIMFKLSDLKNYCKYFENKRHSIFEMAEIKPGEITFLNAEKVKELLSLPLSEDDKKGLYSYFDASTKIMAMEMGMEGLPDGQYREIACDRYYSRRTYNEIMEKYDVSHATVRRAMIRTNNYLAEYVNWYNGLEEKMREIMKM